MLICLRKYLKNKNDNNQASVIQDKTLCCRASGYDGLNKRISFTFLGMSSSSKKKFLSDKPLTMTSRFLQNYRNCSPNDITHHTTGILDHTAVKVSKLTRELVTVLTAVITLVSATWIAISLR
jgi:hypothetical protein